MVLSKGIAQATPRLQRFLIKTFPYYFTVCYIPGLTNQLADCLSQLGGGQKDTIKLPKLHWYQITHQLCARIDSLNQLRISMQEDVELSLLKHTIMQGWPSTIKEVPNVLQLYWTFREELTVENGLIWKGTRIVIPTKKWEAFLKLIHEGHLGLNKCKVHAKDTVYWTGFNVQLERLILSCELCLKYSQTTQYVTRPGDNSTSMDKTCNRHISLWGSILSTDCGLHKQVSCCVQAVIHDRTACCKSVQPDILWLLLARHFGPCYPAESFTSMMKEYGINHITSFPHYLQSNGLAEKFIQIVKNLFYKVQEEGKDPFKSLLIYCNTPLPRSLQCPMQIWQSRGARSDLPMLNAARKQLG